MPKHELAVRLQKLQADAAFLAGLTDGLTTPELKQWASDQMQDQSDKVKALDEWRIELKAPSLKSCREVDEAFGEPIKVGKANVETLRKLITNAARLEMEAQEALGRLAATAAASGDYEGAAGLLSTIGEGSATKGVTESQVWCFEVEDEAQVPASFKKTDATLVEKAMDAAVENFGKPHPIPGIRFYKDVKVKRTGKRSKK